MNKGLFGFDGLTLDLGIYQSPWVPAASFVAGRKVSIPHPFSRRPAFVQPYGRCKIAQVSYVPGQIVAHHPIYGTSGWAMILREFEILVSGTTAPGFNIMSLTGTGGVAMTPANWDISFLVMA